jgi:hypothetical protein
LSRPLQAGDEVMLIEDTVACPNASVWEKFINL